MISDMQWQAFELTQQSGLTLNQASIKMGLSLDEVAQLLESMRQEEPKLFGIRSERNNLRQQLGDKPGCNMYRYNQEKDENNTKEVF